jgi:hypothetical protein
MLPESARAVKAKQMIPAVLVSLVATVAAADTRVGSFNSDAFNLSGALDRDVAPTQPALEIAVGAGYTQGVGGAGGAGSIEDVTGPGGSFELQVGARLSPGFSVGLYGTFARFQHGDAIGEGGRAHAATAGIQAMWHARQSRSLDPWISVGAGWRGLWLTPKDAGSSSLHGIELARLQLGIDYRFSPRFAIAPVIGASAALFVAEDTMTTDGLTAVHDNRLNLYGFTGVLGRFDLGG